MPWRPVPRGLPPLRAPEHALPVDDSGLSAGDAARRLLNDGPNELPAAKPKSNIAIALHVLSEPMFLLLLATGFVYLVLGAFEEAIALIGAIFLVIGITLYQERKTEHTLQALRDLASPRALVIRDGQRQRIPGREVFRRDVLVLSEGDRVAADAFVLSAVNLTVDESLLSGESVPVRKSAWDGNSEMCRPGGDGTSAVFSGTLVVQGTGTAAVHATAGRTEIGKLGRSLESIQAEKTNIERETGSLVRLFATVSLFLCARINRRFRTPPHENSYFESQAERVSVLLEIASLEPPRRLPLRGNRRCRIPADESRHPRP